MTQHNKGWALGPLAPTARACEESALYAIGSLSYLSEVCGAPDVSRFSPSTPSTPLPTNIMVYAALIYDAYKSDAS